MGGLKILFDVLSVHRGRRVRGQAELSQYTVLRVSYQSPVAARGFSSVINQMIDAFIIPAIRSELKPPDGTGAAQDFVSSNHLCEGVSFVRNTPGHVYIAHRFRPGIEH